MMGESDIESVGWDLSIPLKLFLVLAGNGSLQRRSTMNSVHVQS